MGKTAKPAGPDPRRAIRRERAWRGNNLRGATKMGVAAKTRATHRGSGRRGTIIVHLNASVRAACPGVKGIFNIHGLVIPALIPRPAAVALRSRLVVRGAEPFAARVRFGQHQARGDAPV